MTVVALALTALPVAAQQAQAPAPAPAGQPVPAAPPRVTAGPDGIAIESGNGDYRLQFGVLAHAEGRFAIDDDANAVVDTFAVRRFRPYLRGRMGRRFEFYLNPDFAGGTLVVQDAYLDTIFSPAFRIRAGKTKTPFGMERLHPASNLLFFERALPNTLVPNRDVGIQVLGDVAGGVVSYAGAVLNGVVDGGSGDLDTTDSKDLAGRLVVRPARGLAVAFAGTTGNVTGAAMLPTLRTTLLAQPYFTYVGGALPATANGRRNRYTPSAWYFYKSFGGWVEYVHTNTRVVRGGLGDDIAHDAWQVAGSYVLTGEAATDAGAGVRPRNNFDFGNGNWGAFQVAARYHALEVEDDALAFGFAAPGASRKAEAWTLGLNWYLTGNIRYVTNFERTVFDDGAAGARPAEDALTFRMQVSF